MVIKRSVDLSVALGALTQSILFEGEVLIVAPMFKGNEAGTVVLRVPEECLDDSDAGRLILRDILSQRIRNGAEVKDG